MPKLLKVLRSTVIKQSTAQSTTLPASAKRDLPAGEYELVKVEPAPLGHVKVSFRDKLMSADGIQAFQTWFIFVDKAIELPESTASGEIKLPVKWDSQVNSRFPDQAHRMCFSSSIHMALGTISKRFRDNFPKDDDYLKFMLKYGDTTQASAHLTALAKAGFKAQYRQDGSLSDIVKSIEDGFPCCLGILHHGSLKYPTGGGHWICCGGVSGDRRKFLIFDPYGSCVDPGGPYTGPVSNGNGYWCPENVLDARWSVATGDEDGWMMTFYGN